MYKRSGELNKAVLTLTELLEMANLSGEISNRSHAIALYNRACYRALQYGKSKADSSKIEALEDLQESIKLSPSIGLDAMSDIDFISLYKDADFQMVLT